MIVYDRSFNQNEWFVLIVLVVGYVTIFFLRRSFQVKDTFVYLLYGLFWVIFLDHSVSIEPFDFYDVNDSSLYEWMDFLTYLMFGPFAYMYVYLYEKIRKTRLYTVLFVFLGSILAVGCESIAVWFGVYHYKNGYVIFFSFPIYLTTQSLLLLVHYQLNRKSAVLQNAAEGR